MALLFALCRLKIYKLRPWVVFQLSEWLLHTLASILDDSFISCSLTHPLFPSFLPSISFLFQHELIKKIS